MAPSGTLMAPSGIQTCNSLLTSPFPYPLGHHCCSSVSPEEYSPLQFHHIVCVARFQLKKHEAAVHKPFKLLRFSRLFASDHQ